MSATLGATSAWAKSATAWRNISSSSERTVRGDTDGMASDPVLIEKTPKKPFGLRMAPEMAIYRGCKGCSTTREEIAPGSGSRGPFFLLQCALAAGRIVLPSILPPVLHVRHVSLPGERHIGSVVAHDHHACDRITLMERLEIAGVLRGIGQRGHAGRMTDDAIGRDRDLFAGGVNARDPAFKPIPHPAIGHTGHPGSPSLDPGLQGIGGIAADRIRHFRTEVAGWGIGASRRNAAARGITVPPGRVHHAVELAIAMHFALEGVATNRVRHIRSQVAGRSVVADAGDDRVVRRLGGGTRGHDRHDAR